MPDNFRSPYAALGFSDFWRRWHITLSTWLRDYLYIPLGGNRHGTYRTLFNLMFTMFLGGLWHGASWTFIAWGVLHGSYLVVEHFLRQNFKDVQWVKTQMGRLVLTCITFFFVSIAWIFFRASDFSVACMMFSSIFNFSGSGAQLLPTLDMIQVIAVVSALLATHWYLHEKRLEHAMQDMPAWWVVVIWPFMLFGLILMQGGASAFIYFQF